MLSCAAEEIIAALSNTPGIMTFCCRQVDPTSQHGCLHALNLLAALAIYAAVHHGQALWVGS